MVRLRVREIADHYRINRYELGRRAGLSNPTMDDFWLRPETVNPQLRTLERVATALTDLIHEQASDQTVVVTVLDLLEVIP
jgi:hypothetical protein